MAKARGANALSAAFQSTANRLDRLARSNAAQLLGVFWLFFLAAIVQTWPLILHIDSKIADSYIYTQDTYQAVWNLWWVKHALVELNSNPFHTDLLFFPKGTDLYLHTLGAVNGVLSIPLQVATNDVFLSWNILSLILFALSALGTYVLTRRVTGSGTAALLSAYIFAFFPFIVMQLNGRWHIAATWPIPLLALFLVRLQETGRFREAVGAGVCWSLLTYNNLEYAVDAGLFLALFQVYWSCVYLLRGDRRQLPKLTAGSAMVVAAWLILSAPVLVPTLQAIAGGEYNIPSGDEGYSADALAFITPSPLWGPGTEPALFLGPKIHQEIGALDNTMYLGIAPLILAGAALFRAARTPHRVLFWAATFLVFLVLSLGPHLYVDGTKTFSVGGASFSVPLPYELLDRLPVVGDRRVPARMIVFGMLGLSVLAGTGFAYLTSLIKEKLRWAAPIIAVLIFGLVMLEYWNPPVHLSQLSAPAVFDEISREPGDFSVLHVPWGRFSGSGVNGDFFGAQYATYDQAFHHKATLGGYIARTKESELAFVGDSGLWYLACPWCPGEPKPEDLDPAHVRQLFRQYRIKYVVIDHHSPHGAQRIGPEQVSQLDTYLRNVVGLSLTYSDAGLAVYRNEEIP